MPKTIALILICLCAFGCGTHPDQPDLGFRDEAEVLKRESYTGVVFSSLLPAESARIGQVDGYWRPSSEIIATAESGIRSFLEAARQDPERHDYVAEQIQMILAGLSDYRRQYVGIRIGGSERLFISFFPGPPADGEDDHYYWTKNLVDVRDGGHRYWSVQYDVESNRFLDFFSNGYA